MNWDRFDGGWLITFPDGRREWMTDNPKAMELLQKAVEMTVLPIGEESVRQQVRDSLASLGTISVSIYGDIL